MRRPPSRLVRKLILTAGLDPKVTATIAGREMSLPLSHLLPTYARLYPDYSMNVGRLAAAVNGPVVDIGANVGDTATIIRSHCAVPILCIEGDDRFLPFLRSNIAGDPRVEIAETFIGSHAGERSLTSLEQGGTSHLVRSDTSTVSMRQLVDVLQEHPAFQDVRLLKSDTDGYEAEILLDNLDLLERQRPVLFFEFDSAFLRPVSGDPTQLLDALSDAGYRRSVVYENKGAVLFTLEPGEERVLHDLSRHIESTNHLFYVDIAMFHDDDRDLFETFRRDELSR